LHKYTTMKTKSHRYIKASKRERERETDRQTDRQREVYRSTENSLYGTQQIDAPKRLEYIITCIQIIYNQLINTSKYTSLKCSVPDRVTDR